MSMVGTREEYETKCTSGLNSNGPKKLNLAQRAVIVRVHSNSTLIEEDSLLPGPIEGVRV